MVAGSAKGRGERKKAEFSQRAFQIKENQEKKMEKRSISGKK